MSSGSKRSDGTVKKRRYGAWVYARKGMLQELNLTHRISSNAGAGKSPEKPFGIPRRSVSKIADADSTSVFSGIFPAPGYSQ
jgi:hypothetical protein